MAWSQVHPSVLTLAYTLPVQEPGEAIVLVRCHMHGGLFIDSDKGLPVAGRGDLEIVLPFQG